MGTVSGCGRCIHRQMCKYIDEIPNILEKYPFINTITCKHVAKTAEEAEKKLKAMTGTEDCNKNNPNPNQTRVATEGSEPNENKLEDKSCQQGGPARRDDMRSAGDGKQPPSESSSGGGVPVTVPETNPEQMSGSTTGTNPETEVRSPTVTPSDENEGADCYGKDCSGEPPAPSPASAMMQIGISTIPGMSEETAESLQKAGIHVVADLYEFQKSGRWSRAMSKQAHKALNGALTALNMPALKGWN